MVTFPLFGKVFPLPKGSPLLQNIDLKVADSDYNFILAPFSTNHPAPSWVPAWFVSVAKPLKVKKGASTTTASADDPEGITSANTIYEKAAFTVTVPTPREVTVTIPALQVNLKMLLLGRGSDVGETTTTKDSKKGGNNSRVELFREPFESEAAKEKEQKPPPLKKTLKKTTAASGPEEGEDIFDLVETINQDSLDKKLLKHLFFK